MLARTHQPRPRSADKLLFYSLCALLVWLPLPLGSNRAWAWSLMEIWVFVMMAVWCWLYFNNRVALPASVRAARFVLVLFILWLIYVSLQLMPLPPEWLSRLSPRAAEHWAGAGAPGRISVDIKATRLALLLSLAYGLIFFLCLALVSNRRRLKTLAYTLVYSGLLQGLYGSIMSLSSLEYNFFLKKYAYVGVATGTFINRNHLAGYLEMTLAVGIGLMIATLGAGSNSATLKKKLLNALRLLLSAKARLRLALVMMVIALVLTHSRMGNTAFFASLLIAGVIGLALARHAARPVLILLASLIIIDVLIVGHWFGLEKVKQRLQETSIVTEQRDEVYQYVWRQWQDYKLAGSGLGSFYSVFPYYRGRGIAGYYREAHNDYLQFAAETGLIGLGLLGLIVAASMLAALIAHYRRRDPLLRGMSFAAIMGMTAILIHSSVDFNLQIPANAATFMALLALAWISLALRGDNIPKPGKL